MEEAAMYSSDCLTVEMGLLDVGTALLPLVTRVQRFHKMLCHCQKGRGIDTDLHLGKNCGCCLQDVTCNGVQPLCTFTHISSELCRKYDSDDNDTKMHSNPFLPHSSSCSFFGERAPFSLEKDAIRVLLFRECDQRGRKLLYDSKTVVRVPIAESASSGMPSCKTIFKSSKYSGSFITSSASGAGSSSAPATHPTSKKSSSGHVKSSASTSSSKSDIFAEINGGYGYQYLQAENDTKQLGEFVFGTVALAYRGSCSKLHILQNPQRLLLSRSSPAPRSYLRPSCTSSDQGIEDSSFSSSLSSLSEAVISRTESLDMPYMHGIHSNIGPTWGIDMPHMLSTSHSEGDSGFGGPPSPYGSTCGSFLSPPSLPNTPLGTPSSRQGSGSSLKHSGSLNSLQRRFLRNVTTSLEALGREGEMNEDSVTSSGHHSHRTTRLGLAVIIDIGGGYAEMNKQVEDWLFLHLSVIEASLNKLQSSLDAAYLHPRTFASTTHQAVSQLQKDIMDLVSGPRLCRPVWLGLLGRSSSAERQMLCNHFVDTLASVLASFDTKHTNFFVSKLLTAVLTHHLGWVSTVVPGDYLPLSPRLASSTRNGSCGISSQPSTTEDSSAYQATWVERLNESHPYSAVWAQLCELSGAVGYPPKAARTILVGSNSTLLTQLLTILSYVIRCSQITEQDMQSYRIGESPSPEHQQPCFSRTSSVASVVTIVEGGQKDGQSQIRHSSSAKLHRDSSIRRSWRLNRENRSSRFSPLECRTNSGDSTAEMVAGVKGLNSSDEQIGSVVDRGNKIQAESLPPAHSSNKKDKEVSSKWMLNDDVEIIIPREKCAETFSTKIKRETGTSVDVEKSLSTCKTSTNLALLVDDCEASPNESCPVYFGNHQLKTFHEPFSERLYPSLHDLDDHKETFGAVSLEPDVISEKVQKLFRPSKCNVSQECKAFDEQITQLPSIAVSQVPDENGFKDMVLTIKESTINPAHSNRADASNPGFLNSDIHASCSFRTTSVSDNSQNYNGIVHVNPSPSDTICEKKSSSRIIPAKNIKPEIEEGGKVLFLLGDNERIEGLKKHSKGSLLQPDSLEPSWISLGPHNTPVIGFEKFDNLAKLDQTNQPLENSVTLPVEPVYTQITSLPTPLDVRRIVRTRNVGRESALDLTSFERENVIYPSLSELKLSSKSGNSPLLKEKKEIFTKTHRRRHSDPTNGDCTVKTPLCFSRSLKGVLEEQAADIKALSEVKEGAAGSECTLQKVCECLDNTLKEETSSPVEVTPKLVCEKNVDSHMTDSTIAKNTSPSDDEPVVLQMPRISCGLTQQRTATSNGSGAISSSSLASSLLGGVLDHYSSVFVLHATTQVNQWEDVLRQDLYAASHHSTLDPQVSEAVAVVADTDSWEVQVVSSHSFIVERTGCGNQIGLRVGMSPLISAITDSILDLARLSVDPQFILQHLEERLCELYLKSQLLAEYLLGGAACGFGGSEASFSPYHLPELTRALGLDLNDLPLLLAVASTHTPALTRMFGISIK